MTTKFLLSSDDNTRSGLLKKKIIHYYMANGDATIAEVCKEMNLSIPTVTKLISELQEDGYILDFGKQETSGGRKPSIYGLNPVSGYFVGVDILKDQLNLAILDFKGDKIRIEQNIPYTLENTPAALDHLCECINEFINSLPIPREKILSIGINISGRVNPFAGYSYSIFYFEEKPLSQILEEKLHIKIYIENDTRSMAYGEYLQGVVKGEKNILFINISWGLGIGIIIDGKVYFGKSGFSGEFGHFSFFENEILCHCGKKGCLETGASGSALYRTLLERYKEGSNTILASKIDAGEYIGLSDLIDAIQKEDMLSIEILEEIGFNLGKGIAGLMNIFNPELVVLDADLAAATKTGIFKKAYPERFFDCGIAEANMMGIAAGLSTCGKVPFASTFAMFAAGRAFEQVRNSVGYPKNNVKIGATHAGISVGEDGATHQCNEDIALMRTIPGMVVISPADDVEARAAVFAAYEHQGPVYMRFGRLAVPVINDNPDYKFEIGKGIVLREGKDVTIVATGLEVSESLAAAEKLAADGIDAKVINIHTIKPIDEELIVAAAKETGKVVTVEEHSVIGGLGSAVCDVLSEKLPTPVLKIGVMDTFGESGPAVELIKKYGLDADSICEKVKAFVK